MYHGGRSQGVALPMKQTVEGRSRPANSVIQGDPQQSNWFLPDWNRSAVGHDEGVQTGVRVYKADDLNRPLPPKTGSYSLQKILSPFRRTSAPAGRRR